MKTLLCKICLFIIFVVCSFTVAAQNDSLRIDSLKKVLLTEKEDTNKVITLNELCIQLNKLYLFDSCMVYSKKALNLSEKINYKKGTALSYSNLGFSYMNKRSLETFPIALKYENTALKIFENTADKTGMADCYLNLGIIYFSFVQDFPAAMKNYFTALKFYEQIKQSSGIANCFAYIGVLYYNDNNNDEAFKYSYKALNTYTTLKDSINIAQTQDFIGTLLLYTEKQSEALKYFSAAFEIYKRLGENAPLLNVVFNYGNLSDFYKERGMSAYKVGDEFDKERNFSKALKYLQLSLKLENDSHSDSITTYESLGNYYIDISQTVGETEKIKLLNTAKKYFQYELDRGKKSNNKFTLLNSYSSLTVIDTALGNYKQAFEYNQKYHLYQDSISNERNTKKILQSQLQYDFAKKEAIAKAEQDKKDANAKRIKNQQFFAIAALGIVVLAVVIIALIQFRNNKHKQKANLLLERQKQKVETTLTELKSTQQQLIQSEKMASLGELTAGIAHEIQNPLNFVNNFSEVNKELVDELEQEADKGNIDEVKLIAKDIRDNEEKINHHGKRADAIVKGMLQHSRQTKGVKEPTDINALCDEYLRLSYHGLRAKDKNFNADFKTDFDESIGKINIVPQDIGRVLLNLFNNAFYAVNEKKKTADENYKPIIIVATKSPSPLEKGWVEVVVSDNGNGIPASIKDKIFQPFFTTKPTGEGTGLGLSLAYDIITKEHNGTIKVESKEDEGTEFIIQLPFNNN